MSENARIRFGEAEFRNVRKARSSSAPRREQGRRRRLQLNLRGEQTSPRHRNRRSSDRRVQVHSTLKQARPYRFALILT